MSKYDVIVVGAGNGGLVAAASVAAAGYKTLLLEKHNLPGGCATSFVRGRFEFEAALHELCDQSTSPIADSAAKIFERLGVEPNLVYEDTLFRAVLRGENGYDVTLRTGRERFLDDIEAAVPGCRDSVEALLDLLKVIDDAQDYMDSGVRIPAKFVTEYSDFLRAATHSTNEVMTALGIPQRAQDILNTYWGYLGVPSDDLNALHYISLLGAFAQVPPSMPRDRSHALSLGLVEALQANGGEIRYNSEVTRFLYNDRGEAIGVAVGKEKFFAKKIISNIIPDNVFSRSDLRHIPASARRLANARALGMTFITLYLGLDAPREALGINDYSVFIMRDADSRRQFEQRKDLGMYVVNCLNKVLPDSSPEGTCTLFFTIPIMPGDFPEELRPEDYKAYKEAVAERYIRDYEKTMDVRVMEHIEEIVIATPATFARYLGTPEGAIYGYASQTWDNVVARTIMKDLEYRIPNLYFCGGHYIRGDGYPSAYITGAMTANEVIKKLQEGK